MQAGIGGFQMEDNRWRRQDKEFEMEDRRRCRIEGLRARDKAGKEIKVTSREVSGDTFGDFALTTFQVGRVQLWTKVIEHILTLKSI